MPLVDDYSQDEEDDRPQPSGGGMRGGVGGAPSSAAPAATTQKEAEFVPWSRFVSANEEVATREAGKLGSQVQGSVDKALKGRDEAVGAQEAAVQSNYKTKPVPQFGSIAGASAGSSFGESKRQNALTQPQAAGMMGANTVAEQPAPSGFSAVAMPEKVVDPDKLNTTVADGGWKTEGAGLAGGKDLESQLGKDKWGSLVGDTVKAASEANALGSEGGIQALLGKQQGPATAFDAALIGGAGGEQFRDINKQYGQGQLSEGLVNANKGAQDRWTSLMGDIEAASTARDAEIQGSQDAKNAYDAEHAQRGQGQGPNAPEAQSIDELDDMLWGEGTSSDKVLAEMHRAGLTMSPADWAAWGIGEAGMDSPLPTEEFVKNFGGGVQAQNWQKAKVKMALVQVAFEYGEAATLALVTAMKRDPNILASYLQMKNPGFMASQMRAWLEGGGAVKQRSFTQATWDNLFGKHSSQTDVKNQDLGGGIKIPGSA